MSFITSFTVVGGSNEIQKVYATVGNSAENLNQQTQSMFDFPEIPSKGTLQLLNVGHGNTPFVRLLRGQDQTFHHYIPMAGMLVPQRVSPTPNMISEPTNVSATASVSTHSDESVIRPTPSLPFTLAARTDEENLSPYQCLLREQIELFETSTGYLHIKAQGRNNPIQVGQVGLRCRHCVPVTPFHKLESSAIQFSMSVNGIYQVAMKMGRSHLPSCRLVPEGIKKQLLELK